MLLVTGYYIFATCHLSLKKMLICKVLGNVVATLKHPAYEGHKILVVQPLDIDSRPTGSSFLAVDFVQAGEGDTVLVAPEGNAARQMFGDDTAPVHSVITALVDEIDKGNL